MFCTRCGVELNDKDFFCSQCGTSTGRAPVPAAPRRALARPVLDRKIAGVCSGFAAYLEMDAIVMRIIWIVVTIAVFPVGILGYIAAWIVMPVETPPATYSPAVQPDPGTRPGDNMESYSSGT